MNRSKLVPIVLSLAGASTLLFGRERSAAAQVQTSIAVANPVDLVRLDADNKIVEKRSAAFKREGINYEDCVAERKIRFPLTVTRTTEASPRVEVWVTTGGGDCNDNTRRTAGAAQTCWQAGTAIAAPPAVFNVDVAVGELIKGLAPGTPAAPKLEKSMCGKVDFSQFAVYFLLFDGNTLRGTSPAVSLEVDTVGPEPPSGVSLLPGDGRLKVSWNSISGEAGATPALSGVRLYCDPLHKSGRPSAQRSNDASCTDAEVAKDAGATAADASDADAGVSDAGAEDADASEPDAGDAGEPSTEDPGCSEEATAAEECSSKSLVAGEILTPDRASALSCGTVSDGFATSTFVTGLENYTPSTNDVTYAVAVAAIDNFGNSGPLSPLHCNSPEETTSFWSNYRDLGGDGAGCACTSAGESLGAGSIFGGFGFALAFASAMVRRRNRRDNA